MNKNEIQRVIKRAEQLETERRDWLNHWQDIADYVLPRKNNITSTHSIGYTNPKLLDSTAIQSNEMFASSLHGMLTSSAAPWFTLQASSPSERNNYALNLWLEDVSREVRRILLDSNFHQAMDEFYLDLTSFGTAALYIEADDEQGVRFSARHISELLISEGKYGVVDTVLRKFTLTARQMLQRFGEENLPKDVLKILDKQPDEPFKILHACEPRTERNTDKKDKLNKPYKSVWISLEHEHVLLEGGYDEFPYVVGRFRKHTGEIYGSSPAMTALPEIRALNTVEETTIKSRQLQLGPPLAITKTGLLSKLNLKPYGTTIVRNLNDLPRPLLNAQVDLRYADAHLEGRRNNIRKLFYNDIILTQDGPERTATEILQRTDERSKILAAFSGRFSSEVLDPLVSRVFAVLFRGNFLPEPVMEFEEGIETRYVSPLARVQRLPEIQSIERAFQTLIPLQQSGVLGGTNIFDGYDFDAVRTLVNDVMGVPASVQKSATVLREERDARAAAQAAQADRQAEQEGAETLRTVAEAERAASNKEGPVNAVMSQLGEQLGNASG